MSKKISILLLLFTQILCFSQEQNIVQYLKDIEKGNIHSANEGLKELKSSYPEDPSVKFLEAVLTPHGDKSLKLYSDIYEKYPESNYADAALYRVFSYYYSIGLYNKAESYKKDLLIKYPNSPYVKAVNRNIPDEQTDTEDIQGYANKSDGSIEIKYTIQAGAFLNYDNAKNLNQNFINNGYTSTIFPKEVGGTILNVVTVGEFSNESEAENFLNLLQKNYKLSGRIIPVE